jgi:hypothetical protein
LVLRLATPVIAAVPGSCCRALDTCVSSRACVCVCVCVCLFSDLKVSFLYRFKNDRLGSAEIAVCVMAELAPAMVALIKTKATGLFDVANPGSVPIAGAAVY